MKIPYFLALVLILTAAPASAQRFAQQTQSIPITGSGNFGFGSKADLDGNTAVVRTANGANTLVYELSSGIWTQVATLSSQGTPFPVASGVAVVSGDTIAIGYTNLNTVDVFERLAGVWTPSTTLVHPNPSAGSKFGVEIALDGDTLIVGDPTQVIAYSGGVGAGYVYRKSGGVWNLEGTLVPSTAGFGSLVGGTVAIDGDTLILGASEDGGYPAGGANNGSVYVFTRTGSTWTEQQRLRASDGSALNDFGSSLAIGGDTAAIADRRGGLYIFERSATVWSEVAKLAPADTPFQFFFSVDLVSGTVAAGLKQDATLGPLRGALYLYSKENGSWTQVAKVLPDLDPALFANFGLAVAIDSNRILVTAKAGSSYPSVIQSVNFFDWRTEQYETTCYGDGASQFPGCTSCPCSNNASPGTRGGCRNSRGRFARLGAAGVASVTNDTLQFDLIGASVNTFAILFSGSSLLPQNGSCPPGSGVPSPAMINGLRCVGGASSIVRLGTRATSEGGQSISPWGGGSPAASLLSVGAFTVGETRHFQCFYRDTADPACSSDQNSTNAVTVAIAP